MKKFRASVLVLAAFVAVSLVTRSAVASLAVGQAAPDFMLTDITGKTHKLSDYRGKTVVLEWINPECPFVLKHYESGNIPKTQSAAMAEGVVWLSINSGRAGAEGDYDSPRSKDWLQKMNAKPTAFCRDPDGRVGRLYSAKTTPHLFVITKDGTLVYQGAIDSIRSADKDDIPKATNYVAAALEAVKAGRPVAKSATQPYGCSVKY